MLFRRRQCGVVLLLLVAAVVSGCSASSPADPKPTPAGGSGVATSGPTAPMTNAYAGDGPGDLSSAVRGDRPMVYVPNTQASTVQLIDPRTFRVVGRFRTGIEPQHVVP